MRNKCEIELGLIGFELGRRGEGEAGRGEGANDSISGKNEKALGCIYSIFNYNLYIHMRILCYSNLMLRILARLLFIYFARESDFVGF